MNKLTFFLNVFWRRHTYPIAWIMMIIGVVIDIGSLSLPSTVIYSNVTTIDATGIHIGPQPYHLSHPLTMPLFWSGFAIFVIGVGLACYLKIVKPGLDKFKDLYEEDWKHP